MPTITCACGTPMRYIVEEVRQGLRCSGCPRAVMIPDPNNATATEPNQPTTWRSDLPKRHRHPIPWVERIVWGMLGLTVLYFFLAVDELAGLTRGYTRSKTSVIRSQMRAIEWAVEDYRAVHGELPTSLSLLLLRNGDREPYFQKVASLTDPWGNLFLYEVTPDGPLIRCITPNGQTITNRPIQIPGL